MRPPTSAGSLLDHPLISERYFFPRRERLPSPLTVEVDGATLACLHRSAGAGAPTLLHFHGNGEVAGDWAELGDWLGSLGWSALLAEYRGYGMSTGEPELGRMLDDVVPLVEASRTPPDRIVVFGRSVGSLFALHAVSRFPEIAGLVLESGIANVLERLLLRVDPSELGVAPETFEAAVRERLDQRAKMRAYRGPALLLHARDDGLVDVSHAEELAAAAGGSVTLRVLERGDHNSILAENTDEYLATVAAFLAGLRLG
jgi:pimeloyl-ACP methyl ester carboxylesterase